MNTVGEVLTAAQRAIARLDAQVMLCHLTRRTRASLIANPDLVLDPEIAARFRDWVGLRANGKPVAQIIGEREFYGRRFFVDENVLIPRPETEILVEQALKRFLSQNWLEVPAVRPLLLLDMGTGSGAVAVTMALERPDIAVAAVDVSAAALRIARRNAEALNARVTFIESDWYAALRNARFDMIVANPPYIAANDSHLSEGDLRFEPATALTDESSDGLASMRTLISGAHEHLHANGWLMLEHGYNQAADVRALLEAAGFTSVSSVRDLADIERVTMGQLMGADGNRAV